MNGNMELRLAFVILSIIWIGCARLAAADGIFFETGTGWNKSRDADALFLRYQKNTSRLFRQESFYDFVVGEWNGQNRNAIVFVARGLRFPFFHDRNYFSLELGLSYVKNISDNLGTHFQFLSRFDSCSDSEARAGCRIYSYFQLQTDPSMAWTEQWRKFSYL